LLIISYFKVLPTDPRYRDLNLLQKLVLASAIDQDFTKKYEWDKSLFDSVKMYVNPEMFVKEMEFRGEMPKGEGNKIFNRVSKFEKVNSEFIQHSITARNTGKPKLGADLQEAIEWLNNSGDIKPKIFHVDKDINILGVDDTSEGELG